jgi:eukaryotic-like serine/threonine-protein kinase
LDQPVSDSLPRLRVALAARYALERELGHGGMATVYLAEDVKHHRQVAIKVLRPELAAMVGPERFLREVEIAARLNHPHIVPLYDSGEADGFLFYVMPFIQGESLRARLLREQQLPVDAALAITRQVASALGYAHGRQLIHRDIKPENILLHEGEAMVADFGIALAASAVAGERLTQTGFAVGTPEYMSPEQSTGERVLDARSDLYSLACVLYEMLAGEPPFTAGTTHALIAKRLVDPVPSVRRLRPAVPVAVEQALTRALAPTPADRFATTADFVAALSAPAPAGEAPAPCVAVLPFLNLSADPENEYFADGITEDVIASLSRVRALKVISRTSVMRFKKRDHSLQQIASQICATKVLDGSVRRAGDRVRIVAQLVDVERDEQIWAETYDRQLTDIFAIQTDVALHIAAALKAELSPDEQTRVRKEHTSNLQAYQSYLQARHWLIHFTPESIARAIELFQRAIEEDPAYALAYAALAMAYGELAENGVIAPDVTYAKAREAADRALRLDPGLGEAHCATGYLKAISQFDWQGAEAAFQRALQLTPNGADVYDLYGRICAALGRWDQAIALQQRSQELDPLTHRLDVATTLLRAGRYVEGEAAALRAVDFDPGQDRAHATLGWARFLQGNRAEGLAEMERAVAIAPQDTMWQAQLGQAYGLAGHTAKARAILAQLQSRAPQEYVSPYHLAYLYTGLGEHDAALGLLEQAVAHHASAAYGIKGSFLFAPLREHPRFQALLRRMNLA